MPEMVTVTNRELLKMKAALVMLGNRRMATLGADLKVARLLRWLAPYVEPVEELKRKAMLVVVSAEVPEGAELTPTQEQILAVLVADKQAEVDREAVAIDLPLQWALKEADLPKEMSGTDGWKNATQLGAVLADLGPLYLLDG